MDGALAAAKGEMDGALAAAKGDMGAALEAAKADMGTALEAAKAETGATLEAAKGEMGAALEAAKGEMGSELEDALQQMQVCVGRCSAVGQWLASLLSTCRCRVLLCCSAMQSKSRTTAYLTVLTCTGLCQAAFNRLSPKCFLVANPPAPPASSLQSDVAARLEQE